MSRFLSIASAISAVLAAGLTAYVSYTVSTLKDQTTRLTSQAKHSVDRAKLFKELIADLNDPATSNLALLALWQLYREPEHRKIIVLAALEVHNESSIETLIRFDKDLEPFYDTLRNAAESENADIARAASKIAGRITSKQAAEYNLELIMKSQDPYLDANNDNVKNLISLAKANVDTIPLIYDASHTTKNDKKVLLLYIVYAAGERKYLREVLRSATTEPKRFTEFINILCCGEFANSDWPMIVDFAISYLQKFQYRDNFDSAVAFTLFDNSSLNENIISEESRKKIVEISDGYFLNHKNYDRGRVFALYALVRWAPKRAVTAISEVLDAGESNALVRSEIETVKERTRGQVLNLDIPASAGTRRGNR